MFTLELEEPPGPLPASPRVVVIYNTDFDTPSNDSRHDLEACQDIVEVARHISEALSALGFEPVTLAVHDSLDDVLPTLQRTNAQAAFNLVESLGGDATREADLPALLALAGVPCTGNRAATLQCSHDKHITRRLLSARRVPVAPGVVVTDPACIPDLRRAGLEFPVFLKPARADASVGIDQTSIVHDPAQLRDRLLALASAVPGPWLIEGYLPGREFNVAFFPNPHGTACLSEVDFSGLGAGLAPIVTYNCKWVPGTPDYDVCSIPCRHTLSDDLARALETTARSALLAVGASGYGRVDMRLDARGLPRVIDVNPNPDLHPEAGFSLSANFAGFSYHHVIGSILQDALYSSSQSYVQTDTPLARSTARRPRLARRHAPTHASVQSR
jgi:D-alanine-D-alanine ligase